MIPRVMTGQLAELEFTKKAIELGLPVAIPIANFYPYDFVIVGKTKCLKVQVKSTQLLDKTMGDSCYQVGLKHSKKRKSYGLLECDFIAILILPINYWYMIPVTRNMPTTIRLYPQAELGTGSWERFREAWHLLPEALAG